MRRGRVTRVALLAAGLAVVAAGCGEAEAKMCNQVGEAQVCLTEDGPAYRTSGHGFLPGSEVLQAIVDGQGQPLAMRAGEDGEFPPPGGLTLVSRGPVAQRVTISGVSSSGGEVNFEFTVPPADG